MSGCHIRRFHRRILLFEALALSLCQTLPVAQAAALFRVDPRSLWGRIEHYVQVARAKDDMSGARIIGIGETSCKRGHEYVTVVHDLETMNGMLQQTKTATRGFRTVKNFVAIAYLRMSKLKHLPKNPLSTAAPRGSATVYRSGRQVPLKTA